VSRLVEQPAPEPTEAATPVDIDRVDIDSADRPADPASDDAPEVAGPRRPRMAALVLLLLVAVAAVVLDLITKQLAVEHLTGRAPVRILGGAVYFVLTRNSGAAFSMGTSVTWVFPTVALVVVAAICVLAVRLRSLPWAVSFGLVLGGAMGNLIDRLFRAPGLFRGRVVDFISLFSDHGGGFAIFNAADSALVCGVVLAVLLELTGRHRDGSQVRH
jgi:signal peptidase II